MSPRDLSGALKHVEPQWSDARTTRAHRGALRRRRQRRVVGTVAVSVLVAVVAVVGWRATRETAVAPQVSVVVPVEPQPSWVVTEEGAVSMANGALVAGRVRLVGSGSFRADVVEVIVSRGQVLVERTDTLSVSVLEGEAVLRWPGGEAQLRAGEQRVFPPKAVPKRPAARPVATWKQLAEDGDFATAFDELAKTPARDEPGELLLAADVARLSHHPHEALAPLRRVLTRFPTDPRAPLAAFTLGRTLLDELGQPVEAAQAFAKARALGPDGPLVADALARQVEAEARAGNSSRAHALALEYLERYPSGARVRLVRHHGGVE